jgi:hypothetical protein
MMTLNILKHGVRQAGRRVQEMAGHKKHEHAVRAACSRQARFQFYFIAIRLDDVRK